MIDLAQLIAMNVEEADKLNIKDMASLESAMPGIAQTVQKFFRVYKVGTGHGHRQHCRLTICIELDELTNSIRQLYQTTRS